MKVSYLEYSRSDFEGDTLLDWEPRLQDYTLAPWAFISTVHKQPHMHMHRDSQQALTIPEDVYMPQTLTTVARDVTLPQTTAAVGTSLPLAATAVVQQYLIQ